MRYANCVGYFKSYVPSGFQKMVEIRERRPRQLPSATSILMTKGILAPWHHFDGHSVPISISFLVVWHGLETFAPTVVFCKLVRVVHRGKSLRSVYRGKQSVKYTNLQYPKDTRQPSEPELPEPQSAQIPIDSRFRPSTYSCLMRAKQ